MSKEDIILLLILVIGVVGVVWIVRRGGEKDDSGKNMVMVGVSSDGDSPFTGKVKELGKMKIWRKLEDELGIDRGSRYLAPMSYDLGVITEKLPPSCSSCGSQVLYPIVGLGPEYGPRIPENSPCAQFVKTA